MADRFPALEDFDSGAQTDIIDSAEHTTTSNFLEREKAILGEDANQFATVDDADFDGDYDLLDGGGSFPVESDFVNKFPEINRLDQGVAPGGTITGPSVQYNSGYDAFPQDEDEPEVIKEWREKRDAQIAKRAEQFAVQREETIKEARHNIDDFYENYNNKKDKMLVQTRKEAEEFLSSREDTTSGGTSWERIAKIVDVSGKGTKGGAAGSGKERFRELLASLRKDEKAPAASGY